MGGVVAANDGRFEGSQSGGIILRKRGCVRQRQVGVPRSAFRVPVSFSDGGG